MKVIFWKPCKSDRRTKRLSTPFADTWKCHEKPRLPRKAMESVWKPTLRKAKVLQLPPQTRRRHETRHVGASKRAFRARRPQIFPLCSYRIDVFQRVFSWTSKFATSKSMFRSRLPSIFITCRKMLRLPRNLRVGTTWRSATENGFRHVKKHVGMSQNATLATRNEATRRLKPPKVTAFAELATGTAILSSRGPLRTVANGCGRKRNVQRTHPQPSHP